MKEIRDWAVVISLVLVVAALYLNYLSSIHTMALDIPDELLVLPDPEILVVVRYATRGEQAERDRETVEAIAKTVWGEARGCSKTEQAAVVWCILNRVDSPLFPNDPLMVVQQSGQFRGYSPNYPVEQEIVNLVEDVMSRWEFEKTAAGSVGRVLPQDYLFFAGDLQHNYFRQTVSKTGNTWDWSLESPYE